MEPETISDAQMLAILTVLGISGRPADDLRPIGDFLLSDEPIGRILRDALAAAIGYTDRGAGGPSPSSKGQGDEAGGGTHTGVTLVRKGSLLSKGVTEHAKTAKLRQRDFDIGSWMRHQMNNGSTREEAMVDATENFPGIGEDTADAALTYFDRASKWLEEARSSIEGAGYARMWGPERADQALLFQFHNAYAEKRPLDRG